MNKKTGIVILFSMLLLSLVLYLGISYLDFRSGVLPVKNIEYDLFREGDLVFRKGRSIESYAVILLDPVKQFSHTGIIINRQGSPYVVHVVPGEHDLRGDTVRLEPLATFLSGDKASSFAVCRPLVSDAEKHQVAEVALGYYHSRILFDHEYDLGTEDKLYCTELIFKAFRKAGIDLGDIDPSMVDLGVIRRKILLPGDLIQNSSFQMIFQQSFTNQKLQP